LAGRQAGRHERYQEIHANLCYREMTEIMERRREEKELGTYETSKNFSTPASQPASFTVTTTYT
jgi:hypothetical protein